MTSHCLCFRTMMTWALASLAIQASAARGLDLDAEYRRQHDVLVQQMADRSWCDRVAAAALHAAALIAPEDRDPADVVIRRTAALLAHLRAMPEAPDLAPFAAALAKLRDEAKAIDIADKTARYDLYLRACRLRRRIAFANPMLDFDRIVFLTRHRPYRGDHHMVDQYYGFNAKPGGGVHVLENPWSDKATARNLLAESTVHNGRLKGAKLQGGAFNTLDLDYDGDEILFAYSECGPMPKSPDWSTQPYDWRPGSVDSFPSRSHYYWTPQRTFNLFKASVDGTGLTQLTDGSFNDFDPCFLPNGRIAFISERRGGFLRCGDNRPNPSYTLHAMERDGRDIIPLSFHETHEWNPSVDHDGMIVYTRWDYVDRDSDIAHHLWLCYPDGRDPRAFHGNYPTRRELRPWMEMGIRAAPGSHNYVAVAAPHHGYAYGSLVLIDQSIEDDGAMSQIRRITPEAHFPESEAAPGKPHAKGRHTPNGEVYGTPWPLSEMFHLCVYDPGHNHYGIYLIDAFGNKELLWRDPSIACLDPIPLRARPRPPIIPTQTTQHVADRAPGRSATASVLVTNVYEADFDWPKDTKIAALRVIQLYPKATWHLTRPEVGIGAQSLVRGVLGEAPVEPDGSVHFEVPAGVPIYFQALDDRGAAIQSMRSATYLHPGERLTCVGCHEGKHHRPAAANVAPQALQRPPQKLTPPFEAAQPASFPRLVQPVLDRHCVGCHAERAGDAAPLLGAQAANSHGWSQAYVTLSKHAWALSGGNGIAFKEGVRSTPGKVGARASNLWRLIMEGHYDVQLPPDDLKRLAIWLDLNSNFYGAYRRLVAQQRGERVLPEVQ